MEGAEHRLARRTVDATIEQCVEVAIDIPSYPTWAEGVKEAVVTERHSDGLVKRARFVAAAHGRKVTYELEYITEHLPHSLGWSLVKGDMVRIISGRYVFAPSLDEPDHTDVIYDVEVALVAPVPGFVQRRAEDILMNSALERFTAEVCRRARIGR
jgi:hypothetical protein